MSQKETHKRSQSLLTNLEKSGKQNSKKSSKKIDFKNSNYGFSELDENSANLTAVTCPDRSTRKKILQVDKAVNFRKETHDLDREKDLNGDHKSNHYSCCKSSKPNLGHSWRSDMQSMPTSMMQSSSSGNALYWDNDMPNSSEEKWQSMDLKSNSFRDCLNPSGAVVRNQETSWSTTNEDFPSEFSYRRNNFEDCNFQCEENEKNKSCKKSIENRKSFKQSKSNLAQSSTRSSQKPKNDIFFTKAVIRTEDESILNDEIVLSKESSNDSKVFSERQFSDCSEGRRLLSDGSKVRNFFDGESDSFSNGDILDGPVFVISPRLEQRSENPRSLDHLVVLPMTSTKKVDGKYIYERVNGNVYQTNVPVSKKREAAKVYHNRRKSSNCNRDICNNYADYRDSERKYPQQQFLSASVTKKKNAVSAKNSCDEEFEGKNSYHERRGSSRNTNCQIAKERNCSDSKRPANKNKLIVRSRSDYVPGSTRKRWNKTPNPKYLNKENCAQRGPLIIMEAAQYLEDNKSKNKTPGKENFGSSRRNGTPHKLYERGNIAPISLSNLKQCKRRICDESSLDRCSKSQRYTDSSSLENSVDYPYCLKYKYDNSSRTELNLPQNKETIYSNGYCNKYNRNIENCLNFKEISVNRSKNKAKDSTIGKRLLNVNTTSYLPFCRNMSSPQCCNQTELKDSPYEDCKLNSPCKSLHNVHGLVQNNCCRQFRNLRCKSKQIGCGCADQSNSYCDNSLAQSVAEYLLRSCKKDSKNDHNILEREHTKPKTKEVEVQISENKILYKEDKSVQTSVKTKNFATQTKQTFRHASTQVCRKSNRTNESTQCSLAAFSVGTQHDFFQKDVAVYTYEQDFHNEIQRRKSIPSTSSNFNQFEDNFVGDELPNSTISIYPDSLENVASVAGSSSKSDDKQTVRSWSLNNTYNTSNAIIDKNMNSVGSQEECNDSEMEPLNEVCRIPPIKSETISDKRKSVSVSRLDEREFEASGNRSRTLSLESTNSFSSKPSVQKVVATQTEGLKK